MASKLSSELLEMIFKNLYVAEFNGDFFEPDLVVNYQQAALNYPSYLKKLSFEMLYEAAIDYLNVNGNQSTVDYLNSIRENKRYVEMIEVEDTICFLENLLIKVMIRCGTAISMIDMASSFKFRSEIFSLMKQNKIFFSNLNEFIIYTEKGKLIDESIEFLKILSESTESIKVLKIHEMGIYDQTTFIYDSHSLKALIGFIESQKSIKKLDISYSDSFTGVISALNCHLSLHEIIVQGKYIQEFKVLNDCENLEVLRIKSSEALPLLKQLSNSNCRIRILDIYARVHDILDVISFLQEHGPLLQRFRLMPFGTTLSQTRLTRTLRDFCLNLEYFGLSSLNFSDQLVDFVKNSQRLQYISIECNGDDSEEVTRRRVIEFAKSLPRSLHYLNWGFYNKKLKSDYIDLILGHCDAPLKSLFFDNINQEIFDAIVEFQSRVGTLEYCCPTNGPKNYWDELENHVKIGWHKAMRCMTISTFKVLNLKIFYKYNMDSIKNFGGTGTQHYKVNYVRLILDIESEHGLWYILEGFLNSEFIEYELTSEKNSDGSDMANVKCYLIEEFVFREIVYLKNPPSENYAVVSLDLDRYKNERVFYNRITIVWSCILSDNTIHSSDIGYVESEDDFDLNDYTIDEDKYRGTNYPEWRVESAMQKLAEKENSVIRIF
ncbi:2773_t:CDS:2 [Scutellospora calospora]|uniref:2773_t:CDS:1 n=1 Tax=Scutellospora calospora TaxID=85575 RepID=A0ACA9M1D3_9GLOM|nr:2773_t:CDS:2 [Scutellospora calospora]